MVNGQKNNHILYFKLFVLAISFFIFAPLLSSQTVLASDAKQRIYDFAGLLSTQEVKDLESLSAKHSKKRQTDIIILTSKDAQGKDIVQYMEDFYDENGLGYDKLHGNTVILTLDMGQRDLYIAGFAKGEEFLDNKRCDLVRDKITGNLSEGDYYGAFSSFIKTSSQYMGFRPGANPKAPIFNFWVQIVISFLMGGIIVGIMTYRSSARMTAHEGTYRDPSHSRILERRDDYIRTTTTKVKKPSNNNSGGGGSSGSSGSRGGGVSSGGRSHSGSRGKF